LILATLDEETIIDNLLQVLSIAFMIALWFDHGI